MLVMNIVMNMAHINVLIAILSQINNYLMIYV